MSIHNRQLGLVFGLLLGAATALAGCGQKGPLYLTDQFDQEQRAFEAADEVQGVGDLETTRLRLEKEQGSLIPTP